MNNDQQAVLQDMRKRCLAAYTLVAASVSRTNSSTWKRAFRSCPSPTEVVELPADHLLLFNY